MTDTDRSVMHSGGRGDWRVALLVPVDTDVPVGVKHNRPRETRGGRLLPEIRSMLVPPKMPVATKPFSFSRLFLRIGISPNVP